MTPPSLTDTLPEVRLDNGAERARQALTIYHNLPRRGSRSPVYDASTEQFITTLAKEVVHLSETFHRPEIKVLDAVHKAITAVESAILQNMADEEDRLALN